MEELFYLRDEFMSTGTIYLIIVGVLVAMMYMWYVSIVTKRNSTQEALSGIDAQLQKRSNLIPNILTIAKKLMEHEAALMTSITQLRSRTEKKYDKKNPDQVKDHLKSSAKLSATMDQLMITMENYPDLKSQGAMMEAQKAYTQTEEHIAAARRFYNSSVTEYNNAVQIFPGSLIAALMGARPMPFYKAPPKASMPVNASDIL